MEIEPAGRVVALPARVFRAILPALFLAIGAMAPVARADNAGPPTTPFLRIETGTHNAAINALIAAPDGQIITASSDKTGRIWSAAKGTTRGIMRPPIGDGPEGLLYAAALSPSGETVALAGHTGFAWDGTASIYFFDRKDARWRGRVSLPQTDAITAMAFSPVSKVIAVGANDARGLRIVDLAASKIDIGDPGYKDAISSVAFAPDGTLATASLDGKVRFYAPDLVRAGEWQATGKGQPSSVAFSPDGKRVAVGFLNLPRVTVLSVPDGKVVTDLDLPKDAKGSIGAVAWSPDGATVYGAGTYSDPKGAKLLRAWSLAGKEGRDVGVARDTVTALAVLADGRIAYASADSSWGVVGPDLARVFDVARAPVDFRDGYAAGFAVAPNGRSVEFAPDATSAKRFRFDLVARELIADPPARADMLKPTDKVGDVAVTGWRNGEEPSLGKAKLGLDPHERARAVSVLADGSILMGTDYSLRLYRDGVTKWRTSLATEAWSVVAAPDGGFAVAGMGDGSLRWFRLADGVEVLAVFPSADGTRWIAWTPEGFFDHGKGGEGMVGYSLNLVDQGRPKGAELVGVDQLYKLFFRPDLVAAKVRGDSAKLIADQLAAIGDVRAVLGRGLPPGLKLNQYCLRAAAKDQCDAVDPGAVRGTGQKITIVDTDTPEVVLRFDVENRGGGIGPVILRRNGATVPGQGGTRSVSGTSSTEERIVALEPGINIVSLSAYNAAAEIEAGKPERPAIGFRYQPPTKPKQPVLRVLAVGIDTFASPDVPALKNAANDARGMVDAVRRDTSGAVFSSIDATVLSNAEATRAAIEDALAALAGRAGPDDTTLVFLAGHGVTLDGKYYYLPYDLADLKTETIKAGAVSQDALTERLGKLPTWRTAMVLDTCFSGAFAVADSVAKDARDQTVGRSISQASGRFILAGSTSQEEALDGVDGHGVFTGVLLKGLVGAADQEVRGNKDGRVDVFELAEYVKAKVPELAAKVGQGHRQSPRWYFSGDEMFTLRAVAAQ